MFGYGRGFGLRGASQKWPYFGRGRGGLPRCWAPGLLRGVGYSSTIPYGNEPTREEELGYLKNQAHTLKSQLEDIDTRINELEKKD